MSGQSFVEQLKSKFDDSLVATNFENIDPWIQVSTKGLVSVAKYLKEEPSLAFDYLNSVSGVDTLELDEKKAAKITAEPRLEVVYHLYSMTHKHSLVLKVFLPRWLDEAAGEIPEIPTVSHLWPTANWHERETYDLYGIRFTGHPNLRRILCPEDWVGYPMRKDYVMPEEYHGIRGR